ncbi:MAG: hypothetical protein PsegKO_32230 [Pseudohongiellaceae bacterium]
MLDALGGNQTYASTAQQTIAVDDLGEFGVELDWEYLKQAASAENPNIQNLELLRDLASPFVPVEIVCPPIPVNELHRLDALITGLQQAGARGTHDSLMSAFGVHINAELPALDATTVHNYLRAYCLLQWWLVKAHNVDISRRLTPFIDLYPDAYLKRVLESDAPDLNQVIDDYLDHNPTRNRALDMLPLFAELDAQRVKATVEDSRIKARPTFHYRLPNCLLGKPDWSLADSWNLWWLVEELANRPGDLEALSLKFLARWRPILGIDHGEWIRIIEPWLKNSRLA